MFNSGRCSKCERVLKHVRLEELEIHVGTTPTWRGVSYVCPGCGQVLGVSIDPVALKEDIINQVVASLSAAAAT